MYLTSDIMAPALETLTKPLINLKRTRALDGYGQPCKVKLPPAMLASLTSTGRGLSCSTSDLLMLWRSYRTRPKCLGPVTHLGDLDGVSNSWLRSGRSSTQLTAYSIGSSTPQKSLLENSSDSQDGSNGLTLAQRPVCTQSSRTWLALFLA